jgi:5-methylcytosine-specific restriction endonuclease McrA
MATRSKVYLNPVKRVPTLKVEREVKPKDKRYSLEEWRRYSKRFRQTNPTCAMCGRLFNYLDLNTDHIISTSLGGSFFDRRNHQSLCLPCHGEKTRQEFRGVTVEFIFNDRGEKIPAWTTS